MVLLGSVFFAYMLFNMGVPASCTRILEPVRLSAATPKGPSSSKMVELLTAGFKAVDFTKFRTNYDPDQENVYYVVTRNESDLAFPVVLGDAKLLSQSAYDPARRTIVLVHGWQGSVHARVCLALVKAYLQAEDVNIVIVDWNAGARTGYVSAVAHTVSSGESAARFMNWLINATGTDPSTWHLIGHSLGGHLVGVIGRNVNGVVGYLTALDPALPLWASNRQKLRASDSGYTEVIHTNGGQAGHLMPLGHVDIYPNGGINQPGCDGQGCSHDRCVYLMAESLLSDRFKCVQCPSYVKAMIGSCKLPGRIRMGGTRPKTGSTGVYYVQTKAVSPFV